jgi:hypothetical protein
MPRDYDRPVELVAYADLQWPAVWIYQLCTSQVATAKKFKVAHYPNAKHRQFGHRLFSVTRGESPLQDPVM